MADDLDSLIEEAKDEAKAMRVTHPGCSRLVARLVEALKRLLNQDAAIAHGVEDDCDFGSEQKCVYCDVPLGGGKGGWYSLVTPGQERCDASPTTFHEANRENEFAREVLALREQVQVLEAERDNAATMAATMRKERAVLLGIIERYRDHWFDLGNREWVRVSPPSHEPMTEAEAAFFAALGESHDH